MVQRELFTFEEVKKYLKINRSTLYKFVQAGKIPAVKLGRQWRFDLSEIDKCLTQQSSVHKNNRQEQAEEQKIEGDGYKRAVEKRKFFRLVKNFPVRYSLTDNPEKIFKAIGRNISEDGLFIEAESIAPRPLAFPEPKQKTIRLIIELPHQGATVEAYAGIVWLKGESAASKKAEMGLRFLNLPSHVASIISTYILKNSFSVNGLPEFSLNFPNRFESSIVVKRNQEEVFKLLREVKKFPEFIEGINSVKIIEQTQNRMLSEWNVNIDDLSLKWRQLDVVDSKNSVIRFGMLEGDFETYRGQWSLTQLLSGTEIHLSVIVDWGVHSLRNYVSAVLEKKTQEIFQRMLEGIKKNLWVEKPPQLVKFAFMVHPFDLEVIDVQFTEPSCRTKRRVFLEKIFEYSRPFACAHVTGVQSVTEKKIDGELIYCPLLPNQILNLDSNFVLKEIIKAAKIAEKIGAKILGLGAYTAGVGRKGVLVANALSIPVTTGTSYTIAIGLESIMKAADEIGIKLNQAKVVIIGATGAIGNVFSQILADKIAHLILVARNEERLSQLTECIRQTSKAKVEFTKDINKAVQSGDIIITSTSTPSALFDISLLQPGTLIFDMSVPKNISLEAANSRQDVLTIDGGVVKPPGKVNFNFYFGLAPDLCYACMAETMILALEEKFECYSIGGNISLKRVKEISRLAAKHGFKLAELRSFGSEIPQGQLEAVSDAFKKRYNS